MRARRRAFPGVRATTAFPARGGSFLLACLTRKNRAGPRGIVRCPVGAVTVLSLGGACKQEKARTTHPSRFLVLDLAVHAIEVLCPVVATVRRFDRDLGEQLRTALSSVVLNVAEGNRSQGGHRIARFSTAAGSNAESRAALRVAVAWGYVTPEQIEAGEAILDRVAAMLHGLGARR